MVWMPRKTLLLPATAQGCTCACAVQLASKATTSIAKNDLIHNLITDSGNYKGCRKIPLNRESSAPGFGDESRQIVFQLAQRIHVEIDHVP